MIVNFDYFGFSEKPSLTLCNPDGTQIHSIGLCYNTKLNYRFNALSELNFDFAQSIDNMETTLSAYDYLKSKRLVLLENFGYFIIGNVEENTDGSVPIKHVYAVSIDGELLSKKITAFGGYYYFYNVSSPSESLLHVLLNYMPNWTINHVDDDLKLKYRSFDVSDTSVYGFLMEDVEQAYGCVFKFDLFNKQISAYTVDNSTTTTQIYLSYDNLLKNGKFTEIADEITTRLFCYGGADLDIRNVNPLGENCIYNFDYYKNTDWMSQDLIDAIDAWESLIAANTANYQSLLLDLQNENANLVYLSGGQSGQLLDLQGELLALEAVQEARILAGLEIATVNGQIAAKQAEIDAKEAEILVSEGLIAGYTSDLQAIVTTLDIINNFTAGQLTELNNFIFENTYQNENIIKLDSMTPDEVQVQSQELYDQSDVVLQRISQPRYEFSVDTVNFTAIQDFQSYIDELDLGCEILIQPKDDYTVTLILLEINLNFDNPRDFSLTFGNRVRLDNGSFVYTDLMGQSFKAGSKVSFKNLKWDNWNEYKSDVTTFVDSALDATTNNIIVGQNQEILINENGLKARHYSGGSYDLKQAWLTNNILAFTDDGWDTAKLALGEVELADLSTAYGVAGQAIVGKIVAGSSLQITNSGPGGEINLTLDENGLSLVNASFVLTSGDDKSRITIDPDVGIKIETKPASVWGDVFYVDTSGNLIFAGTISSSAFVDVTNATGTLSVAHGGTGRAVYDGWIGSGETWTYASTSTFTVSGDQTSRYTKGAKIKWTQTTVKYGVVASSSYANPNTTVTIIVNSDYTVANAAITDPYYSYEDVPSGFPGIFNFSSTWSSASNPQPSLGDGSLISAWSVRGGYIRFILQLTMGSTTTTGTGNWSFSIPRNSASSPSVTYWGNLYVLDADTTNRYHRLAGIGNNQTNYQYSFASNSLSTSANITPTDPITFAQNDIISLDIEYLWV